MKRIILIGLIAFLSAGKFGSAAMTQEVYVYICTGPQSKRYHNNTNCKGLKSCSKDVVKVTLQKAKSMGRTQCGYCYK